MNRIDAAAWLFVLGCRSGAAEPLDAAASPQASAEPVILVGTPPGTAAAPGPMDAAVIPLPFRADRPLAADSVPREVREGPRDAAAPRESREARDLAGLRLTASLRPLETPAWTKSPELNVAALEAARRKTDGRLLIELAASRLRIVVASSGLVLPVGTELRARADRYGHVVVWPDTNGYRLAAPGSLRALFGERRLDVAPLATAYVGLSGEGSRAHNLRTRRVQVDTRAGKATIDLATIRETTDSASLLCRTLLDFLNAAPSTPVCGPDELPLHATFSWSPSGGLVFDVLSIEHRADLRPQDLAAPPAGTFLGTDLPLPPAELLVPRSDLPTFRSAPVDLPSAPDASPIEPGLVLVNSTDQLLAVWVDGVALLWVAPGAREVLLGLVRGRYTVQWRTFLGEAVDVPQLLGVPGVSEVGAADGGRR